MFPVDYEESVSDDFRTIFSHDNVLTPVQYLWQWLFNRQSLGKTPPPQQLPPIIIYATTEIPTKTTTTLMTTTTMRDEFIPGRTRRPLKYKVEGKSSLILKKFQISLEYSNKFQKQLGIFPETSRNFI